MILRIIFLSALAAWSNQVFTTPYNLYSGGEIVVIAMDTSLQISVHDLCAEIVRGRPDALPLRCRIGDEWLRDSVTLNYLRWLQQNAAQKMEPQLLRARDPAVAARLQEVQERHIITLASRNDTSWVILFHGEISEPAALHYFAGLTNPSQLARTLFRRKVEPLPTAEQKAFARTQPDSYFEEAPPFLGWVGTSTGISQATVPLTPRSWYRSTLQNQLENFRYISDSSSAWNFVEDEALLNGLRVGGIWHGFIGAELFVLHSRHGVKYSRADTNHSRILDWHYDRWEIGLVGILTKPYAISPQWDLSPQGFVGFNYSFNRETFAVQDPRPEMANLRLQLEPYYKGAIAAIGARLQWKKMVGLDVRTGISSRGRTVKQDPGMQASDSETIAGAFTLDYFLTAGLQWTFRK